jgi:hypothetical protein
MKATRTASWAIPWFALLLVALAAGCGAHESSVSGSVTLSGKPLDTGTVTFHPVAGGAAAYARIGPDGRYVLKTGSKEGLAPGDYVVTVVATAPPAEPPPGSPPMPGKLLTPSQYGTVQGSPLRRTIRTGSNTVDLQLQTP